MCAWVPSGGNFTARPIRSACAFGTHGAELPPKTAALLHGGDDASPPTHPSVRFLPKKQGSFSFAFQGHLGGTSTKCRERAGARSTARTASLETQRRSFCALPRSPTFVGQAPQAFLRAPFVFSLKDLGWSILIARRSGARADYNHLTVLQLLYDFCGRSQRRSDVRFLIQNKIIAAHLINLPNGIRRSEGVPRGNGFRSGIERRVHQGAIPIIPSGTIKLSGARIEQPVSDGGSP